MFTVNSPPNFLVVTMPSNPTYLTPDSSLNVLNIGDVSDNSDSNFATLIKQPMKLLIKRM